MSEEIFAQQDEVKPLSTTVGMAEKPQPAVILVLNITAADEDISTLVSDLEKLKISAFLERSAKHAFVCLYLTSESCEEMAEKMFYHVPISTHIANDSSKGITTKLSSLYHYGSFSYNYFTEINYSIMFNRIIKSKLEPEHLSSLHSVRVQSELIYYILREEEVLDREKPTIEGHFVPHTPQASKLRKKMSWFPPFFPLEEFRAYFGEELAFVYAWSNFWWSFGLIPLALVALISLIYGLVSYEEPSSGTEGDWSKFARILVNTSTNYYLGFMMIWIAVYQYKWVSVAPILSVQWGVSNFNKEEPCYRSPKQIIYRQLVKIPNLIISLVGILVAASLTIILFVVVEIIIRFQLRKFNRVELRYTNIICPVIYTILNTLAGDVFMPAFARFLTNLENHKFRSYYINSIIFKFTGYYLVSSYFYLTFLSLDLHTYLYYRYGVKRIEGDVFERYEVIELTQQLIIQIVALRLRGVVISFISWCISKVQRRRLNPRSDDLKYILENYKSSQLLDTSSCSMWMSERVIMYGFLTMFSYHVPIVAIIALVIEVFVTKYEMHMLLRSQRPQPRRVANIKQWEGIIYMINVVSIIINSYSLSLRAKVSDDDCAPDYGHGTAQNNTGWGISCVLKSHHLPFLFMPIFITISTLIEIQDAVSGDNVQEHLRNQYRKCYELIGDLIVTGGALAV